VLRSKGFTLVELTMVLVTLCVLAAIALPATQEWRENAQHRASARHIAAMLREARSLAVNSNLEHRVEFDLGNRCYRLTRGNRSAKSTASSWKNNVVRPWAVLSAGQVLRGNAGCDLEAGVISIHLNPNGTGNSRYVCLLDEGGSPLFRIGVPVSTTSRIVIQKWNNGAGRWQ
jgi:prepilin-type N-terminal cleavage/methylation domain-containing protein